MDSKDPTAPPPEAYAEPLSPNWKPSLSRPDHRTPALSVHGNPIGRPPGALNKARGEAKAFCQMVIRSEEYRQSVLTRAKSGTLPPAVEVMMWHYAYGKPTEHVQISTAANADLSELTTEQLAERAKHISEILLEAADARAAAAALDKAIDEEARARFAAAEVTAPVQ